MDPPSVESHFFADNKKTPGGMTVGETLPESSPVELSPEDELEQARLILKKQEEELIQLRKNQSLMEAEVQDLTASLFEEANKMVNTAAAEKFSTEKALKEAKLQVEGLQAEVSALKTLVLTSTPSNPNLNSSQGSSPGISPSGKLFRSNKKGHQKAASQGSVCVLQLNFSENGGLGSPAPTPPLCCDHDCKRGRGKRRTVCRSQSGDLFRCDENAVSVGTGLGSAGFGAAGAGNGGWAIGEDSETMQCDPKLLQEFKEWRAVCRDQDFPLAASLLTTTMANDSDGGSNGEGCEVAEFLKPVLEQEINPCLDFPNLGLTKELRSAVKNNTVIVECRAEPAGNCALLEAERRCDYTMRLCDSDTGVPISELCRNRITAVCDFFNYLKYIQQGLVKSSDEAAFQEVIRLRKNMALAKLGCTID